MAGSGDDGSPSPSSENHHQSAMMTQLACGAREEQLPGTTLMAASKAFSSRGYAHPFAAQPPPAGSKNPRPMLMTGIGIAAMLLLAVPLLTVAADARGGGGGGGRGGGGFGGHGGGFGGGHIGGFGGRVGGLGGGHIGGGFSGRVGGGHIGGLGISGRGTGAGLGARSFGGSRTAEHSDRAADGDGEPAAGHAAGGTDRASGARSLLPIARRRTEGALHRRGAIPPPATTGGTSANSAASARPG